MYNAQKYGYKFEILRGYKFERGIVFKTYVELLYGLRTQYNKSEPLNYIAKILLNSLYGRFGMSVINTEYNILSKEDFNNLPLDKRETIVETVTLGDKILVCFNIESINEFESYISVSIAAAITAYSRIHMSQFKNNPNIRLFYTDTDSIFTDKDIPEYLIGKDLGQFKDELKGCQIKKAYFLGIKKYGYVDSNGKIHSIFSGVERDSLTWNEIEQVANGFTIMKNSSVKFFKSFNNLNITIQNNLKTSIEFRTRKLNINNKYLPIKINIKTFVKFHYYFRIIINKIIKIINKYGINKIK